ncbi:hypothetical protein D3C72_1154870 [compost metagenome]
MMMSFLLSPLRSPTAIEEYMIWLKEAPIFSVKAPLLFLKSPEYPVYPGLAPEIIKSVLPLLSKSATAQSP